MVHRLSPCVSWASSVPACLHGVACTWILARLRPRDAIQWRFSEGAGCLGAKLEVVMRRYASVPSHRWVAILCVLVSVADVAANGGLPPAPELFPGVRGSRLGRSLWRNYAATRLAAKLAKGQLAGIKARSGKQQAPGLADKYLDPFLALDWRLVTAIDAAKRRFDQLGWEHGQLLQLAEPELVKHLQGRGADQTGLRFLPLYDQDAMLPYVPLAAFGPWEVTSHGAVIYNAGGYGMLGWGHAPQDVLSAIRPDYVQANVMGASLEQHALRTALEAELGVTRGGCPYDSLVCLNAGSEGTEFALMMAGLKAAERGNNSPVLIVLEGGFHGRTYRPAGASDSTRQAYAQFLPSAIETPVIAVPINDEGALRRAFEQAGEAFGAMMLEPVMGEGNPGVSAKPWYYELARELSRRGMLLVDSVQAGFRATGYLSIVDYQGFRHLDAPDGEIWSKSLFAGQVPLSVVGLTAEAAAFYRPVYGSTNTANPRAAAGGAAVLAMMKDAGRDNIRAQGEALGRRFEALVEQIDGVDYTNSTGLLLALGLDPDRFPVLGPEGVERALRDNGLNVIHSGLGNALRFTPVFDLTAAEVGLIADVTRDTLTKYTTPD